MSRISTHILDMSRGQPASDVPVRLESEASPGNWRVLNAARTDGDGRCTLALPADELPPGFYRLVFDTASYFGRLQIEGRYPVVEITFQVRAQESQLHMPLLLSANGYTTYRGVG